MADNPITAALSSNFEDQLQYYDRPEKIIHVKLVADSNSKLNFKQEAVETEAEAVRIGSLCKDKNEILPFAVQDDKLQHTISAFKPGLDNVYRCNECTFQTKERFSFSYHIQRHKKNINDKRHKCDECDFETMYMTTFRRHLIRHKDPNEIVRHKCPQCDFEAKHNYLLKQHLILHMDPEQRDKYFHKCPECDYKTLDKSNLNNHIKRHTGTGTKYKCNDCDFVTIEMSRLRRHLLVHSNLETMEMFYCDDCDYKTHVKAYLTKHLFIHKSPSEVLMYKCELCDYETRYKSQVIKHHQRHKRSHHNLGKRKGGRRKKTVKTSSTTTLINEETKDHPMTFKEKVSDGLEDDIKVENTMLDIKIEQDINESGSSNEKEENDLSVNVANNETILTPTPSTSIKPVPDKEYKCSECSFQIEDKFSYENHILWHRKNIKREFFKCSDCQFETINLSSLNEHVCITSLKCEGCNRQTLLSNDLKGLLQSHKGSQIKFQCGKCMLESKTKGHS